MTPKDNQSEKDSPLSKKKTRKTITLEQKMDILRRYDRGESTAAIRSVLNLPYSTLLYIRDHREKIMAVIKSGTGSLFRSRPCLPQPPTLQPQQEGRKEGGKELRKEREKRKKERMNGGR